jgi:hypothetical protein
MCTGFAFCSQTTHGLYETSTTPSIDGVVEVSYKPFLSLCKSADLTSCKKVTKLFAIS